MRKIRILSVILLSLLTLAFTAKEGFDKVKAYLASNTPYNYVLTPEGEFVVVFNSDVAGWIKEKLDKKLITEIGQTLKPYLYIELDKRGFAPAAIRAIDGKTDETHYDAIWVRDNVWVYYSLLADLERKNDAKKLILALWDYYSTAEQIKRFEAVIAKPDLSTDQMAMPHIRFDGSSPDLGDVMIDGKPQVWNHRQIDAHGLFFTALAEAFSGGLLTDKDLTRERFKVLLLYPHFLERIKFTEYEDAGAWEELPRRNTSSIALATRSLEAWRGLVYGPKEEKLGRFREKFDVLMMEAGNPQAKDTWLENGFDALIKSGLERVKYQLKLGGESPDYNPDDIHFRLADMALMVIICPSTLDGLSENELRNVLLIMESLKRPAGFIRYNNDSYQSGNYWIKTAETDKNAPALTGDTSSRDAFLWRLGQMIPDTEAEWFFDSLLALCRLRLAEITTDDKLRAEDLHAATIHLKRALGQITGDTITADGLAVRPWQSPESINTVVIDGKRSYLPSRITPLNWAKAGLSMALSEYERVAVDEFGQQLGAKK
jgi:hypothetical protein